MASEYVFVDEWDVRAPQAGVVEAALRGQAALHAPYVAIKAAMKNLEPYASTRP